jgi:hypothetical protein
LPEGLGSVITALLQQAVVFPRELLFFLDRINKDPVSIGQKLVPPPIILDLADLIFDTDIGYRFTFETFHQDEDLGLGVSFPSFHSCLCLSLTAILLS